MDGISAISKNEVKVSGYNGGDAIIYNNLVLNEAMININSFSFSFRPKDNDGSLSAILSTKKELLGKDAEIKLANLTGGGSHVFKGIVTEVNSSLASDGYYEFYVSGHGKFCKVNEVPECHSYYKKSLKDILTTAIKDSSLAGDLSNEAQTGEQHYIVQYEQSPFAFATAMAVRFGEWMYYDGDKLKFGKKPDGDGVALKVLKNEVFNLNIRTKAVGLPKASVTTDIYKSEVLNADKKENASGNDFVKEGVKAGDLMEHPGGKIFIPSGFKKEVVEKIHKKIQEARIASSVFITGNTRNAQLGVGSVIKIVEGEGGGEKYIITEISHQSSKSSQYSNFFTAVPADVKVPPYANPLLFPKATPQPAVITDNEDDKGLARVKVKFPWMAKEEKSPWISVIVPHAGKDKGFRFLPEVEDEVMVDFWDNNAETPFVSGAVYTEKNKAGIAEKGNNIKRIGSRSGRRLDIDDDKGKISIYDYGDDAKKASNDFSQIADGTNLYTMASSGTPNEFLILVLDGKGKEAGIDGRQSNTQIVSVRLDMGAKKVTIKSQGDIDITAGGKVNIEGKQEINLKSTKINIEAQNELNMKGTSKANLSGAQIDINANATLKMKANTQTAVEGAMLDLKGTAMANLQAALVKIN